jgi:hypothetical protein
MRNPGFEELFAFGYETLSRVKRQRISLRIQVDDPVAVATRQSDQAFQYRATDPFASPGFKHRHATDVAIGQQPSCANRATGQIPRNNMSTAGIDTVPFELFRYLLFDYEDAMANGGQFQAALFPGNFADFELSGVGHVRYYLSQILKNKS